MKLANKQLMLAKIETSYGVNAAAVAANAMVVWNLTSVPLVADMKTRDRAFPNFGSSPQAVAQAHMTTAFDLEASGAGAPGTPPLYGSHLRSCGISETITTDTKVEYSPISSGWESETVNHFIDGVKMLGLGARGNLKATFQGGELPTFHVDLTALYSPLADAAFPAGIASVLESFIDSIEVNQANTQFSIHGYAAVLEQLTFDQGGTVAFRDRPNAASVDITNRSSTGQLSFEMPTVAAFDIVARAKAGTLGALSLAHGSIDGNIIGFDAPAVQLISPTITKRGDTALVQANLAFTRVDGDDEWKITVK